MAMGDNANNIMQVGKQLNWDGSIRSEIPQFQHDFLQIADQFNDGSALNFKCDYYYDITLQTNDLNMNPDREFA